MKKAHIRNLLVVLALVAAFFLLLPLIEFGLRRLIGVQYADTIGEATGWNSYLVKAIAAVIAFVVLFGFKNLLFNRKNPLYGAGILLSVTVVFNLGLYFATRDSYRDKCYAETPEGLVIQDCGEGGADAPYGTDPTYGLPLEPITEQTIGRVLALQRGCNRLDPARAEFFNRFTSEPQVWYYRHPDGSYDFYDGPCHHPKLGVLTKPATRNLYGKWQEYQSARVRDSLAEEKDAAAEAAEAAAREADQRRIADFRALVNTGLRPASPGTIVGFVVRTETASLPAEEILAGELRRTGLELQTGYFKPAFKESEHFRGIAGGRSELLVASGVMEPLDYLLLAILAHSCREGSSGYGLYACDVDFTYTVVDRRGRLVARDVVSVTGPGVTEDRALRRGLELVAENHGARVLGAIR